MHPILCLPLLIPIPGPQEATSTAAREERLASVDQVFAAWDSYDDPGMAVGILWDGELVYAKGFGMANLEVGLPNGPEVLYRIGSTSKQFTATALAMLVLDGEVDLDAPLGTYFPEIPDQDPPVLMRHLVHHTSGLPDYIGIQLTRGGGYKAWFTPESTLEVLAEVSLDFTPGSRYEYSNSNYFLMGECVRRVSGQSLRDFAREHIFDPLGMEESRFQDRHDELIVGRSHGYSAQDEPDRGEWRLDITTLDHVGDGGVFTSIEDLAKWDANFYASRLRHGQALIDLVTTRGELNSGEQIPYAMGLIHGTHRGLPTIEHGGSWVGYLAQMLRFPEQRFTVFVLANQTSVNPVGLALAVADRCLVDEFVE